MNYGDGGGLSSLSLRPDKAFDLIHRYARPGEYTVAVTIADDELASDTKTFVVTVLPSTVQGRHVFYNGSSFDGGEVTANAADDAATAPDKSPLLPGSQATSANYTNYSRGLNGIFVDITGLVELPTPADFELRVGNDNNPSGWATAPAPQEIALARRRVRWLRSGHADLGGQRDPESLAASDCQSDGQYGPRFPRCLYFGTPSETRAIRRPTPP